MLSTDNLTTRLARLTQATKKIIWTVNPATGEVTPRLTQKIGVSPNTAATLETQEAYERESPKLEFVTEYRREQSRD